MSQISSEISLKKRITTTLLVLSAYRLGTFIPLPGVNIDIFKSIFSSSSANIFGMVNLFSGGALERMSIFALNIMPYITSSIIMQLLGSMYKSMEVLKKEGADGRKKINQYTRYLTIFLALIQSIGVYYALSSSEKNAFISDSNIFFWTTCATLVGGTVIIMWFGERITSIGIGNGISLIIFVGIVSSLPSTILQVAELLKTGVYSFLETIIFFIIFLSLLAIVCFIEKTFKKVKIQYPSQANLRSSSSLVDRSFIPLKINISGVIPPIFASSVMIIPSALYHFIGNDNSQFISSSFARGGFIYSLIFSFCIVFFSYFYSSMIFNTQEVSNNLKKSNCFILGMRPGKVTSEHLDRIIFRITALGSSYLIFICILPEILIVKYSFPIHVGGTGIMIMVNVILDSFAQIQSHIISKKYGSVVRKKRLRVKL
jgi:preprotein translocase subunit SecY